MGLAWARTRKICVTRTRDHPSALSPTWARILATFGGNSFCHREARSVHIVARADVKDFVFAQVTAEGVGGGQTVDLRILVIRCQVSLFFQGVLGSFNPLKEKEISLTA